MGKYDDIIQRPRPVSRRHAPMSRLDRASQFSPFAALTGYEAVIDETGRLTDEWAEPDESRKAELNEKLLYLAEMISLRPQVTVTFFLEDDRKAGGAYQTVTGHVKKIDPYGRKLVLCEGEEIPICSINALEID